MSTKVLELLPEQRAIVSTEGLYRIVDQSGCVFADLLTLEEAQWGASCRTGNPRVEPYPNAADDSDGAVTHDAVLKAAPVA